MNNLPTPRNANEARRLANSYEKALTMAAEGYTFEKMESGSIAICKPGRLAASYWIGEHLDGTNGCDCPDFTKNGSFCKHTIFVLIEWEKEAQEALHKAEEEEMFEEQCREYDTRAKYEW